MTVVRASRWIVLLSAFVASVTWSYIAIDHLLSSSMTQEQRSSEYNSAAHSPSAHLHLMEDRR